MSATETRHVDVAEWIRKWRTIVRDNTPLIVLTFELFWIFVFTLERFSGTGPADIPQFIYVSF